LDQLVAAAQRNDGGRCRALMRRLLPEYHPSEQSTAYADAPYPERF
jgi:hypothetical protein